MNLELIRVSQTDEGTFGVLLKDELPLCVTLELPWKQNAPNISCIPAGSYNVQSFYSEKHGQVWEILNVPARSAILLHEGNFPSDSMGCIICAQYFSGKETAIYNSVETIKFLRSVLASTFTLKVLNPPA